MDMNIISELNVIKAQIRLLQQENRELRNEIDKLKYSQSPTFVYPMPTIMETHELLPIPKKIEFNMSSHNPFIQQPSAPYPPSFNPFFK